MTDRRPGFIAISRDIFSHSLFKSTKPYSRLEAWEWLINAAAWKPKGHRWRFGVIHLDRGQLATSVRELAATWHWTKSSAHRFLLILGVHGMVDRVNLGDGTRTGTRTGTHSQRSPTILTICNYDKFQQLRKRIARSLGHEPGHEPGHELQQAFGFMELSNAKPLNQLTKESRARPASERRREPAPRDGEPIGKNIWCRHGTEDWRKRARDYREVRGVDILPEHRKDGAGNYFHRDGEAARDRKKAAIR